MIPNCSRESRGPGRPKGSRTKLKLRKEKERYGGDEVEFSPIPKIEDDYLRVKRSPLLKMSDLTLRYLKFRKLISSEQFVLYNWAHDIPEDRTILTEKNIVEHLNLKLIGLYESI